MHTFSSKNSCFYCPGDACLGGTSFEVSILQTHRITQMLSGARLWAADSATNKQNRERSAAERPGPHEYHTQAEEAPGSVSVIHRPPGRSAALRSRFCFGGRCARLIYLIVLRTSRMKFWMSSSVVSNDVINRTSDCSSF